MESNIAIFDQITKRTDKYELIYRVNRKTKSPELIIRHNNGGRHFASHNRFNLLDDYGNIIENRLIDVEVARFIIDNFELRGDTLSFEIYNSDLKENKILPRATNKINPQEIRHKLTFEENSFTSTGNKLEYHWPIFEKYQKTNFGSIIRATLTLHQVCSSHCNYCSTIGRNKKDSISLQEAKDFVKKLYFDQAEFNRKHFPVYNNKYKLATGSDIRLKGLILSGGGQPNLWPHFEEFVNWLSTLDIDLGLITNGFPSKINESVYEKFKWIRISITPEDASPHYINGQFNNQYIPKTIINNKNITVGYSYVYGPWTNDEILMRIEKSIDENGFDYCRTLTDCNLARSSQLRAHQNLAERLYRLNLIDDEGNPKGKIFHQLKYHGSTDDSEIIWPNGQCQLQIYNVFWDTTGHEDNGYSYCYSCDSITVLSEENEQSEISISERKFNHEKWGTVKNTDVNKLYEHEVKKFFDPREICTACLFVGNNKKVNQLVNSKDYDQFIDSVNFKHVNFP